MENFPVQLPWSAHDVPHVTIEVNQGCNIRCHACYKEKSGYSKPLQLILEEIEFAAARRRLSTVSLAGGEPLLHPEIAEVVRAIAKRNLRVDLLTNGTLLSVELLKKLKGAGLSKIMLHIDARQNRPELPGNAAGGGLPSERVLRELRHKYVGMCRQAGVEVNYTVTIYRDTLFSFSEFVDDCHRLPEINAALITDYAQSLNADIKTDDGLSVRNADITSYMGQKFDAWPAWYIPSTHSPKDLQWLLYTAAVTVDSEGQINRLFFHPRYKTFLKFLPRIPKWLSGRFSFDNPTTVLQRVVVLTLYAALSGCPRTMSRVAKLLRQARKNGNLKLTTFIFQQSPVELGDGEYSICLNCPDSTVRNFRFMPLCLADKLDPVIDEKKRPPEVVSEGELNVLSRKLQF